MDDDRTPSGVFHAIRVAQDEERQRALEEEHRRKHDEVLRRVGEIARAAALECFASCPHLQSFQDIRSWITKVEAEMKDLENAVQQIEKNLAYHAGRTKAFATLMALITVSAAVTGVLLEWSSR